ncbi:hypothetical protein BP5796_09168 [Coleophoma crateriformis]|uniref:Uncharacterized protein n=1 Tax=Coleophoma crateriformis TaxID=565419 RepID=A0A3D8R3L8_9HELO|nr:hypothetical protein BP5796_09168 [Coleophoma crateriformis]
MILISSTAPYLICEEAQHSREHLIQPRSLPEQAHEINKLNEEPSDHADLLSVPSNNLTIPVETSSVNVRAAKRIGSRNQAKKQRRRTRNVKTKRCALASHTQSRTPKLKRASAGGDFGCAVAAVARLHRC